MQTEKAILRNLACATLQQAYSYNLKFLQLHINTADVLFSSDALIPIHQYWYSSGSIDIYC